jgi:hypothetical protein
MTRRGVARLQGGFECREPDFRVGLRRKARAIVDQCHRQILLQRRRDLEEGRRVT